MSPEQAIIALALFAIGCAGFVVLFYGWIHTNLIITVTGASVAVTTWAFVMGQLAPWLESNHIQGG